LEARGRPYERKFRSSKQSPILSNCVETDLVSILERPAVFKPGKKILALANVKGLELIATLCDRLNSSASDANTTTNRESFQVEEMQTYTA
jgi:hypothetical protein